FEDEREWRFHHSLMRDVVYESVLKRRRSGLHREAGAWLEMQARKADRVEDLAGIIGEHAERAGKKIAAADWYLRAGKRSRSQGALFEARDFFGRTVELLPTDEHQSRWLALLELDGALAALGSTENRKEGLDTLIDLAEKFDEPSRLALANYRQAVFSESMGETPKALEIALPALQIARDEGEIELEMRLLALKLVCKTRIGELDDAIVIADELLSRSEGLEEGMDLALVLTNVAVFYTQAGDSEKAVNLLERQIEINNQIGERIGEAIGYMNIGYNYIQLGQFETALAALERSLKLHEALGARRMCAYDMLNIGLCDWRIDETATAVESMGQALGEFEAIGDAFGRGSSLLYLALAYEHLGELTGAEKHFTRAREVFSEVGMVGLELDAIAGLARCTLTSGSHGEAQKFITELWDHLSHDGATGMEFPVLIYQTCAKVFESLGDSDKSKSALDAGYQTLMTQADKITNMELRQSYLDNVPENRALFEMWSRCND
ncbi:MAG: tetratricopeptide repeat protein, partial [Candidatus Hermodarchaeia archaeon]